MITGSEPSMLQPIAEDFFARGGVGILNIEMELLPFRAYDATLIDIPNVSKGHLYVPSSV
jgi:hypothetical protein